MSNLPTNDYDARIVIDVKDTSFMVSHTANIDINQVYMIFLAAVEYMETEEFGMNPNEPRTLN
jgi:hypothetical protein